MIRVLLPIAILILVVLGPDLYITKAFMKGSPLPVKVLQWVPTLVMILVLLSNAMHILPMQKSMTLFFGIILLFALPKFIFMAFSLLGRLLHIGAVGNWAGLSIASILFVCILYGLTLGYKRVSVRNVDLSFEDLPESFEGYRIVQISDWHLGTYAKARKTIRKEIELANCSSADVIVFTGDLVNGDPAEMDPFMDILSTLKAPDGVFSIMGNHDYCMYAQQRTAKDIARNIKILQQKERDLGWRLFLNQSQIIHHDSDSIAIIGVENNGTPPFPQYGDLDKAQDGLGEGMFKILLSHDPTYWRRSVLPDTDIQLTLSGHTHAAQVRLWNFSPSKWIYSEWGGLYEQGDRKLFVCTGSGGNVAFRFGAWPEIVRITLHRK